MRWSSALLAIALGAAAPALAEPPVVVSAAPEEVGLAIYGDDLALVRETRTVNLPVGEVVVEFRGVSDAILPDAAIIEGLDGSFERNFDYDILSPYALVSRAVGSEVSLVRTNPGTGVQTRVRARVVSGGQGVVLDFGDGRIEAVECSGLPEGLVFDTLPAGLRAEPTLSTRVHNKRAGSQELTLVYLAHGLSWQADYNLRLAPDGERFDLEAWLTLANDGGTSFSEAETAVVAGELYRVGDDPPAIPREWLADHCWEWGRRFEAALEEELALAPSLVTSRSVMADSGIDEIVSTAAALEVVAETQAGREELLDYHFYRVPWRTTVAARQSKQVRFLTKRDIRGEWLYRVDSWISDRPDGESLETATTMLRFENEKENGLGEPLPSGTVRVAQQTAAGQGLRLGEDEIGNSAAGIPVELELGDSASVFSKLRVTDASREELVLRSLLLGLEHPLTRFTASVERVLSNARPAPAIVEVRERGDARVSRASHRWKKDRGRPTFRVEVPANGSVTLRYRVHVTE